MDDRQRQFLDRLLESPSPSGFETRAQRVWLDHVTDVADDVRTDEYGNAIATHHGTGPTVVVTGHADEIGFIVRRIDDDGFIHLDSIGGADRTVSLGQHVTIHASAGSVPGVIGQTAIHLRDRDEETPLELTEQRVDIGATDGEHAREFVEVGDPITISTTVQPLAGTRIAARGLDDRMGTWAAAEGFRHAVERATDATVHAVSTIQEEVGLQGARMVGFDLAPDAVVAIDVTHANDHPRAPPDKGADVALGGGPVVNRGSANHPELVRILREAADTAGVDVQLQAAGTRTGTDTDAFFTQRGGTPAVTLSVPLRYMHTPVETLDLDDLAAVPPLVGEFLDHASGYESFAVDV